ncbi:amidohydrolase family protein [Stella sp.]|uniref:N-acyl-D-amino-acid deacylase family protein n=1 Tax=Stella sp. TaxID=2912054 RepID=UPI0035B18897
MLDLIFRGAQIVDGTGAPAATADLGVAAGRIAAIGRLAEPARDTVAADGLVLAPGIVDVHTHYDAQLTWDPTASPSTALGVTTVVMGNCGFSIAPCPPERRDLVARNLSEVEGMSLASLRTGIDWRFEGFGEYLDLVQSKGPHLNVAAFVGHSTVRSAVMGEAASERPATADEIAAMRALVADSLAAGAVGFASSHSENHNGYGGVPMPSRLADEGEIRTLAGTLGAAGRGVYQMTAGPNTSVAFLESLGRDIRRPVIFSSVFQNDTFPDRGPGQLRDCAAAAERGVEVYGQTSCQPLTMEFTLANAYPLSSLDVWDDLRGAEPSTLMRHFADPGFRDRFRATLGTPKKGKLFYGNWSRVQVGQAATDAKRAAEGRSIADLAAASGADPVDTFFDLGLAEGLATLFSAQLINADEDQLQPMLQHPNGVIALSDAGAHLSFLCDAGYGLHLLGHWVRDRRAFTLEEAVRQLTSKPAGIYRIPDRGRIAVGAPADLMLFDPARIAPSPRARRVPDLPGGDSRMVRDPIGMHGVWVNGVRVHDGRDHARPATGPGRVLRHFSA